MFAFNLNHKDPVKRRIYNDLRFRQALSYAVDRHRINQTLYFGEAKEWQATISPNVSYFDPPGSPIALTTIPPRQTSCSTRWASTARRPGFFGQDPDGNRFVSVVVFNKQTLS